MLLLLTPVQKCYSGLKRLWSKIVPHGSVRKCNSLRSQCANDMLLYVLVSSIINSKSQIHSQQTRFFPQIIPHSVTPQCAVCVIFFVLSQSHLPLCPDIATLQDSTMSSFQLKQLGSSCPFGPLDPRHVGPVNGRRPSARIHVLRCSVYILRSSEAK